MDDPLARAAIQVIADDAAVQVTGVGETMEVPAGRGISLPANTAPHATMELFEPRPIKGGVYAELAARGDIELIPESDLASFGVGAPVVYSIPGARTVDLSRFRGVAAQTANHDLQLVIVAGGVPVGGS